MSEKRPIFGIFEGGGAKGLAHIGALEAVEANNLEFFGVAGASAGAIVATLVAAGYRSTDIFNPELKDQHILSTYGATTTGILGDAAWNRFGRARRGGTRFAKGLCWGGVGLGMLMGWSAAVVAAGIQGRRGHFSTAGLRDFLNRILYERLLDLYTANGQPQSDVPARVLFKHLDCVSFPRLRPLKIVATDLGAGALTVFDASLTPDVEVAEAVAASVAIPLVFEPVVITSYRGGKAGPFVDGGLVSNSPTWVFAEEKLALERADPKRPPVPIISFTLVDKIKEGAAGNEPVPVTSMSAFIAALGRTAIFGSQAVSQRFIEDVLIVPLETELGLLDFDAPWGKVRAAYLDGRRSAAARLMSSLTIKPDRVRNELQRMHDVLLAAINGSRAGRGEAPLGRLRANLIERFGVYSFRVVAGYNMRDDADDRLLIDSRGRGAPEAVESRSFALIKRDPHRLGGDADFMTKYERALVRPQLRTAICVPIFTDPTAWERAASDRPEPRGVFCVDSDEDLETEFHDPVIERILAERSSVLSSIFDGR